LQFSFIKKDRKMKALIIIAFAFFLVAPTFGQENKMFRKQGEKALKKEKQREAEANQAALVQTSIHYKKFVLEGQFLSNKYGEQVVVDPILNFISVDGEECTFQLGKSQGLGPNGLGGVTIEGKIKDFEVQINKKGIYYIKFRVTSSAGTLFIHMDVSPLGKAHATITSNTSSNLIYIGNIVPLESSRIFKGSRSY